MSCPRPLRMTSSAAPSRPSDPAFWNPHRAEPGRTRARRSGKTAAAGLFMGCLGECFARIPPRSRRTGQGPASQAGQRHAKAESARCRKGRGERARFAPDRAGDRPAGRRGWRKPKCRGGSSSREFRKAAAAGAPVDFKSKARQGPFAEKPGPAALFPPDRKRHPRGRHL